MPKGNKKAGSQLSGDAKSIKIEVAHLGRKRAPKKKKAKQQIISANDVQQSTLSGEQKQVIEAILQGRNVFFSGSAGTGKSFLLHELIKRIPKQGTAITASTGLAALNISGTTLHSFAALPWNAEKLSSDEIARKMKESAKKKWRSTERLIIDEISMINGMCVSI